MGPENNKNGPYGPSPGVKAPRRSHTLTDTRNPEVNIDLTNNPTGGANINKSDDVDEVRPTDGTVIWYHSLGETERQIKGLRLHAYETLSYPSFVVLAMNDNSFLSLEISQGKKSVDVTRLTDSEVKRLIPSSIQVDFLPTKFVDLKFAISVCYGVLVHVSSPTSTVKQNTRLCQHLFALALFLSIVRQHLPIDKSLIENVHTVAAVDNFWGDILSQNFAGQILWEKNLVESVYQIVRHAIYKASQRQLEDVDPIATTETQDNEIKNKSAIVQSAVAWLESTAHKKESLLLNLWDSEWDKTWDVEWEKNWKENWSDRKMPQINLIDSKQFMPPLIPMMDANILSGRSAGRTAGRTVIDIGLVAKSISEGSPPLEILMLLGASESSCTVPDEGNLPPMPPCSPVDHQEINKTTDSAHKEAKGHVSHTDNRTIKRLREPSWFASWYSIRRPDLKQHGRLLPVWEVAHNMAWALERVDRPNQDVAVPQATSQGVQKLHFSALNKKILAPPSPVPIAPGVGTTPERSTEGGPTSSAITGTPSFQNQIKQLVRGFFGRPETEPQPKRRIIKYDLLQLSQSAWDDANSSDPRMKRRIEEQAEKASEILDEQFDEVLSGWLKPTKDQTAEVFQRTLEKTWQRSWERSWEKVTNDTSARLKDWVHADGDPHGTVQSSTVYELASYKTLESYLKNAESMEECHWRIRSAFKALNILHGVMVHSVPICYEEAMKIKHFPDRPYNAKPSNNPIIKGLARTIQLEDREKQISHNELQVIIQELCVKLTTKFPVACNLIEGIEDVWARASRVYANPKFMNGQDLKLPYLLRKVQTKPPPKRKSSALIRAQSLWQKALKELRARKLNTASSTRTQTRTRSLSTVMPDIAQSP